MGFSLGSLAPEILPAKGCGWNGPGPDIQDWGWAWTRERKSFCLRGHSGWSQSAEEVTLALVSYRSYLAEVKGQSVSLVVILAEVRWPDSYLDDSGDTLVQVCVESLTWVSQSGGYSG